MADPLPAVLAAAEHPRAVIGAADARWWPGWAVPSLERVGVLAPDVSAESVACEECGEGHVERVEAVEAPGRPRRWFHPCPTVGRVRVEPERLRRWAVRPAGLGAVVGRHEPAERMTGLVWALGPSAVNGVTRIAWLVAGWRGEAGLGERVPELTQPTAAVFVPHTLPPAGVWGRSAPPLVIPLSAVLALTAQGLSLDAVALAAFLPAGLATPNTAPSDPPADQSVVVTSPPPPLISLPAGLTWKDVTLGVGDFDLTVRAGGHELRVGYEALGLADRRTAAPDGAWRALVRLAAAGELSPTDATRTKSGTLKNHVSRLRAALRRLTGLAGDPFHRTGRLRPYRPQFRVRPGDPT